MQRILIVLLLVVSMALVLSNSLTFAAQKASGVKLERGAKNLAWGWTEIPKSIVDTTKSSNAFVGITCGTLKGICQAVARTVSGAVEVATFPIGASDRPVIKPSMVPEATKTAK